MAYCLRPTTMHHLRRELGPNSATTPPPFFNSLASFYNYTHILNHTSNPHLSRLFPLSATKPSRWSTRCRATSPGPPSPPELDPPPGDNPSFSSGVISRFSRIQDTVRIFCAVLFWMSLFFWSCVWDGKNDGGPKNGSRFKR